VLIVRQKGHDMISRRKNIAATLAVGLLALGLAACGSDDDDGGDSSASGERVSLRFGGWDDSQTAAMEAFIAAFEKKNKNVNVTYETVPFNDFKTKLQVQASNGNAPDVFWLAAQDRDLYASEGVIKNISDLVEETDFDMSVFPEAAVEAVSYEGDLYGLPRGAATIELWYNKEIFDAAGVAYPTADWTWEDLQAAAAELTDESKGIYGVAATFDATQSFYNTIWQAGGQVISDDKKSSGFDSPETCAGIKFWTDLIEAGSAPTYEQTLNTAADALFTSGKAAMVYAGAWFPGIFDANADIRDKIDVVQMPAGPAGDASLLGVNLYSMYAETEHPEEAFEFLSFISGSEGAKVAAESKVITQPAEQGAAELWASLFPQWNMQAILDSSQVGHPFPVTLLTTEWTGAMIDALAPAFNLKMSPEEACASADKAIEDVLAKESG
jgi:multiple sugar transport system substrate-binding protein